MAKGQQFVPPINHPPAWRGEFWGFDPDLRAVGWAKMQVTCKDGAIVVEYLDAGLITAREKAIKGLAQTQMMARRLTSTGFKMADDAKVIIEAQEFYADSKVDANDLLRLAQITGQLQLLVQQAGVEPLVVLPRDWKQNKQKEGMHSRARVTVASHLAWEEPIPQPLRQHAWDAVCMALWAANQEAASRTRAHLQAAGSSA